MRSDWQEETISHVMGTASSADAVGDWCLRPDLGGDFLTHYKSKMDEIKYYAILERVVDRSSVISLLDPLLESAFRSPPINRDLFESLVGPFVEVPLDAPDEELAQLLISVLQVVGEVPTAGADGEEVFYRSRITTSAPSHAAGGPVELPELNGKVEFIAPLALSDDQVSSRGFQMTPIPEVVRDAHGNVVVPKVIVGVVDDAINFANERFRVGDTSRVEFAWMQDAVSGPTVPIGREYSRREIEQKIAAAQGDPEALMRAFGHHPTQQADRPVTSVRGSHGTHVADIAAGLPSSDPHALDQRLITVQMPSLAYFDSGGIALNYYIEQAVKFIIFRAWLLKVRYMWATGDFGLRIPVVINISYGLTNGSHSGAHYLERRIDDLIQAARTFLGEVEVVVPTGNEFLTRRHAASQMGEKALDLRLRVPARDRTHNFLEVWLPKGSGTKVSVKIPGNSKPETYQVKPGKALALKVDGQVVARITQDQPLGTPGFRPYRLLLAIAPTDTQDARQPRRPAPPGIWEVKVEADVDKDQMMEAFIHREDPNNGFPRRDPPCYFEDWNYQRYIDNYGDWNLEDMPTTSVVRRFGTINGIANGQNTIAVGAYRINNLKQSLYSGASRLYGKQGPPDLMAPADLSRLNRGILASGTRSGSTFIQTGTSVSAPMVTREIARYWASGRTNAAAAVVDLAKQFELNIGARPSIPANQLGAGRLKVPDIGGRDVSRGLKEPFNNY